MTTPSFSQRPSGKLRAVASEHDETIDEALEEEGVSCFFDGDEEREVARPSCSEILLQPGEGVRMEILGEFVEPT